MIECRCSEVFVGLWCKCAHVITWDDLSFMETSNIAEQIYGECVVQINQSRNIHLDKVTNCGLSKRHFRHRKCVNSDATPTQVSCYGFFGTDEQSTSHYLKWWPRSMTAMSWLTPWTKWPPFSRRFSNAFSWIRNFAFRISLKFTPDGLINNKSTLGQVMAWSRRTSDKSLSELIMTQVTDAYMRHWGGGGGVN